MEYAIEIADVAAAPLAAVETRAELARFPDQIRTLFDRVYAFLDTSGLRAQAGQNVILYPEPLADGSRVVMGVQVPSTFEPEGDVLCSTTPGGRVARTIHCGPYAQLGGAYAALASWCGAQGVKRAGPAWEIYGDWFDDPALLRTDVLALLA